MTTTTGGEIRTPRSFGDVAQLAPYFAMPMFAAFSLSPLFHSTQQMAKLPVFALAAFSAACFVLVSAGRLFLHHTVVLWTVFFVAVGLFWVELGVLNRTPGAIPTMTVYVVWPVVFLLFINMMNSVDQFRRLAIVFFAVSWLAAIADIGYLLEQLRVIPGQVFSFLGSRNSISLSARGPEYSSSRVGVMLFAVPVLIALIVHRWEVGRGRNLVLMSWLLLLPMLFLVFIAQRRAIYVVLFLAPFFALGLDALTPRPAGRYQSRTWLFAVPIVLSCVGLVSLSYLGVGINWAARIADFVEGFDFSGRAGDGDITTNARTLQLAAMIQAWTDSPIIGAGHGASASIIRDRDLPWAYELTYGALLFQTGTLGFLAYFSGIAWTMYRLILIIRDPDSPMRLYAYGMLNGMIGLLIGSATNPYLVTFDSLWAVFMPIGLVNLDLLRRQKRWDEGPGPEMIERREPGF